MFLREVDSCTFRNASLRINIAGLGENSKAKSKTDDVRIEILCLQSSSFKLRVYALKIVYFEPESIFLKPF